MRLPRTKVSVQGGTEPLSLRLCILDRERFGATEGRLVSRELRVVVRNRLSNIA